MEYWLVVSSLRYCFVSSVVEVMKVVADEKMVEKVGETDFFRGLVVVVVVVVYVGCVGVGGVGMRSAIVGIGAGIGAGMTYSDTKREFERLVPTKNKLEEQTAKVVDDKVKA